MIKDSRHIDSEISSKEKELNFEITAYMDAPPQLIQNHHRHIPSEVIGEILSNLPVKSLLRFRSVSKSWHSTIDAPWFVKKYRRCSALPGRERYVVYRDNLFSSCPLSDILSANPVEDAALTDTFQSLSAGSDTVASSCNELWCLKNVERELLSLWNPSMRTYRHLPPRLGTESNKSISSFGLGYDAVNDDYKLVLLYNFRRLDEMCIEGEMYSLRSDSWKRIAQPFPQRIELVFWTRPVLVNGALHWMVYGLSVDFLIISFDLSTEMHGEVLLPKSKSADEAGYHIMYDIHALRGKLCLCMSYYKTRGSEVDKLSLWMMEDYGVAESWTYMFQIPCHAAVMPVLRRGTTPFISFWKPFFIDDDDDGGGQNIVNIFRTYYGVYVYKDDGKTEVMKNISQSRNEYFIVSDSLVSPAIFI